MTILSFTRNSTVNWAIRVLAVLFVIDLLLWTFGIRNGPEIFWVILSLPYTWLLALLLFFGSALLARTPTQVANHLISGISCAYISITFAALSGGGPIALTNLRFDLEWAAQYLADTITFVAGIILIREQLVQRVINRWLFLGIILMATGLLAGPAIAATHFRMQ